MIGVIYARYSSDNQREESIEGQLRECRQYADRNGITLLDPYIDRAYSAKTDNRPSFLKMVKDSAAKKFDTIIVWKLDRFARNRYDSAHYNLSCAKTAFVLFRQPNLFQKVRKAFCWNLYWKVWRSITRPTLHKK